MTSLRRENGFGEPRLARQSRDWLSDVGRREDETNSCSAAMPGRLPQSLRLEGREGSEGRSLLPIWGLMMRGGGGCGRNTAAEERGARVS